MSCCSCGGGCLSGCGCRIIILPENPAASYGMENINLTGVGVYDGTSGTTFQMRGIASANSSLSVTFDAGNNVILLTLDLDTVVDDLPQATTTQRGVGETATDAEAIAKASLTNFVTPSNFAAMASSTTFAGLVELATDAETQAGISSTLAVTPAGLQSVLATLGNTTTFADAAARAGTAPDFEGQYGYQIDTNQPYIAFGTSAGNWNPMFAGGITNNFTTGSTTTLNLAGGGATLIFDGAGSGIVSFTDGNYVISDAGILDFQSTGFISIGGTLIPADSVLTTGALFAGHLDSRLINTFISTANTQTGWTVTNPSTSRTLDVAAATLAELRAVVGTLITDLKAVKLPAT